MQGHSIDVELDLMEATPPPVLYHGTSVNNVDKILKDGLLKMKRQYVHLSENIDTVYSVGERYGIPPRYKNKYKEYDR